MKAATLIIAVLDLLANIFLVVQFGGGVAVMGDGGASAVPHAVGAFLRKRKLRLFDQILH